MASSYSPCRPTTSTLYAATYYYLHRRSARESTWVRPTSQEAGGARHYQLRMKIAETTNAVRRGSLSMLYETSGENISFGHGLARMARMPTEIQRLRTLTTHEEKEEY